MSENEKNASSRKRSAETEANEASPHSNIVSRAFSSLFKRRRRSSPVEPSASSHVNISNASEEKKSENVTSPKLSSPLPPLNLASTRLNKPSSSTKIEKPVELDDPDRRTGTLSALPRFSIGKSDSSGASCGLGKRRNNSRVRSGIYSRSRSGLQDSLIQTQSTRSLGRSRSNRLLRGASTATIGTFSVGDSVNLNNSKPTGKEPFTKMRQTATSRLLERRRKYLRRKKITSKMTTDLVNRALEAHEGILFPPRATSTDLGLSKSSSSSNGSLKASVIGKYKVGGSRLNQVVQNNTPKNIPEIPQKSLISQQQIQPPSASLSQSRGVRFNMTFASKSPEPSTSTPKPPKHMPSEKTPAIKRQILKSPMFSSDSIKSPKPDFTELSPINVSKPINFYGAKTPTQYRELELVPDVDSEFVFTTKIDTKTPENVTRKDIEEYERSIHSSKKRTHFGFVETPKKVNNPKKRIKKGTPYPKKRELIEGTRFDCSKIEKTAPISTTASTTQGWGANMFAKPGEWTCDMCLSRNPPEKKRCMACEAPRDKDEDKASNPESEKKSTKSSSFVFGGSSEEKKENTPTTQKFIFGVKKDSKENRETKSNSQSTNGFTFGGKKDAPKTTSSNTGSFTFGTEKVKSKAELSQFGTSTPGNKKDKPISVPANGGFVFGGKKEENKSPSSTTGGFNFGAKKEESQSSTQPPTSAFVFSATNKDAKAPSSATEGSAFGAKKEEGQILNSAGFAFGTKNKDNNLPSSSSKVSTESKSGAGKVGGFSLKSSNTIDQSKTSGNVNSFPFGGTNAPTIVKKDEKKTEEPLKFAFGKATSSSSINLPVPSIQNNNTDESSKKKKRSFGGDNGNDEAASAFPFASDGSSVSGLAATPKTETAAASSFQFGATSKAEPTKENVSQFGSSTVPPSSNQLGFGFGPTSNNTAPATPAQNVSTAASTSTSSFVFGSNPAPTASNIATTAPSFTFNVASSSAIPSATKTQSISFGTPATPAGAPTTAPTPASATNNFSFGQSQPTPAAQPQTQQSFVFGGGTPAPAAQPASQGTFNFGSTSSNAATASATPAASQFGAGNFGPQGTPSVGGFGSQATPSTGAFGTHATTTASGFNSRFRPNMTVPGGGGGFSIGTGGTKTKGRAGVTPRRRIVKAKRPPGLK